MAQPGSKDRERRFHDTTLNSILPSFRSCRRHGTLFRDGSVLQDEDYHAKMVEATEIMKEAIAHTPKSHPEWRFKNHISLAYIYRSMFKVYSEPSYLDDAFLHELQEAGFVTEHENGAATFYANLSEVYQERFGCSGNDICELAL